MSKWLVLVDHYHPWPNTSSYLLSPILAAARDRGIDAIVLCVQTSPDQPEVQTVEGVDVVRVPNLPYRIHAGRNACGASFRIRAAARALEILFRYGRSAEGHTRWYSTRRMLRTAKRIVRTRGIDTLVSVNTPFASHRLGAALKKTDPGLRWIAFEMDPYAFNGYDRADRIEERRREEARVYARADRIVSLKPIYDDHVRRGYRSGMEDRLGWVPDTHLVLGRSAEPLREEAFDAAERNLVYTGLFHDVHRPPEALFGLLSRAEAAGFALHLYGRGHERILARFPGLRSRAVLHGHVPKETCDRAVRQADVLVSIGNDVTNMSPSKVVEYMTSGRPIVHFAQSALDPSLDALRRYGNALVLFADRPLDDTAAGSFFDFCRTSRGRVLPDAQIAKRMGDDVSERACARFIDLVVSSPVRKGTTP